MSVETSKIDTCNVVALLDDTSAVVARPRSVSGRGLSAEGVRDLIVDLAEAAEDIRLAAAVLMKEAEAVRLALEAIRQIKETGEATHTRMMAIQADHTERLGSSMPNASQEPLLTARDLERLTRPLGLAAAAAIAVNASITSSSMALTEASLRVVRAGEKFVDASRLPNRKG
jgi:hypothetical protein